MKSIPRIREIIRISNRGNPFIIQNNHGNRKNSYFNLEFANNLVLKLHFTGMWPYQFFIFWAAPLSQYYNGAIGLTVRKSNVVAIFAVLVSGFLMEAGPIEIKCCFGTSGSLKNLQLFGVISDRLSSLQYLQSIDLSFNNICGSIPDSLGNLSSLKYLDLSYNNLIGPIPKSLGMLQSLEMLILENNFLNNSIPPALGDSRSLQKMRLTVNQLDGPIPKELGKLTKLDLLDLRQNKLSGNLPSDLGNLANLRNLWLSDNNITGPLPPNFAKLVNLESVYLMGNNFEGPLPGEINMLGNLIYLWITDLNSNHEIPLPSLSKSKSLRHLILRNCSLTDQIPQSIGNLPNLAYLDLSYNNLTGEIPDFINKRSFNYIYLTGNEFYGTIPDWITNSTVKGDLSYNKFSSIKAKINESAVNLFSCCSPDTPNMTSPLQIMNAFCPRKKSKYHSLFINCGGESTNIDGNHYEEDYHTSPYYVSSKGNWAYIYSGDFLRMTTSPRELLQNNTCAISAPDAPLYATARASPTSLKYHGFCLHPGTYTVTFHFLEIVYTDDNTRYSYSSLAKRIFDVYIQGTRLLKDFNIKDEAGGPNKALTKTFNAIVKDHCLTIHLYWAGKGSIYISPQFYGPLISAISITPDFKLPKLSTLAIL